MKPNETLNQLQPNTTPHSADYDQVAELYDHAFSDIRVRKAEWTWIVSKIDKLFDQTKPRVLDIGCGNGALLNALSSRVSHGTGVDVSANMLEYARKKNVSHPHLNFQVIQDSLLPYPDNHFDVVISFLSFRYLDWESILYEIKRVLTPTGRFLLIDMVSKKISYRDFPVLMTSALHHFATRLTNREFIQNLYALVSHPKWKIMLKNNPIRADEEYRSFFESRFFPHRLETLTTTRNQRLIAFDTGPIYQSTCLSPKTQ